MSLFFERHRKWALTYIKSGALALAFVTAGTATARAERSLTLDEALHLARQNNRDLGVARARLDESKSGVEQAVAALLPTAAATGTYTHNYKNETFGGVLPASFSKSVPGLGNVVVLKQEALQGTVGVNLPILVPAAYASLDAARATFEASKANFEVSETSVLYSVAQAFFAAAGADELVQARQHAVEVSQVTLNNAQARLAAGTVNRTEVTRAQLVLLNSQQAAREAHDIRDQAYRSLSTILVLREPIRVAPPAPVVAPAQEIALEPLATRALQLRPEFAAYEANVKAARVQAIAYGLKWLPTVSGFFNASDANYAGFTGDKYSWAVGAQLNWTIFDGGLRDAARCQYEAERVANELQLAQLHDTVNDDITNASRALGTRRSAFDSARQSVALAGETLDLLRAQYDAGTATELEVLQSQDALIAAEVQQAQARFDLALADLSLQRYAGTFPAERTRQ